MTLYIIEIINIPISCIWNTVYKPNYSYNYKHGGYVWGRVLYLFYDTLNSWDLPPNGKMNDE
jgi:hypothetical protein